MKRAGSPGDGRNGLVRFGVSMEPALVRELDRWVGGARHTNRSEAIRSLVRKELSDEAWREGGEALAVISLIYDHHKPDLLRRLSHVEHEHTRLILSAQHIHLDHYNCLEVIVARGKAERLSSLVNRLRSFKGVKRTSWTGISLKGRE